MTKVSFSCKKQEDLEYIHDNLDTLNIYFLKKVSKGKWLFAISSTLRDECLLKIEIEDKDGTVLDSRELALDIVSTIFSTSKAPNPKEREDYVFFSERAN